MKRIYALMLCVLSSAALATPLSKIVAFGDSLSDNGNLYSYMKQQLPMSPPYFEGRFTNGPVWVELLAEEYYPGNSGMHMENYAYGGAGILDDDDPDAAFFTLKRELNSYFSEHADKADANAMYTLWIGANNYLALPEGDVDANVSFVIKGIQDGLEQLVAHGAKHLLVVNLPDLGRTPAAIEFESVELLTAISTKHNDALKKLVDELKERHQDVQWVYMDVHHIMLDIFDNPASYGFTNLTGTCYQEMMQRGSDNAILSMVATVKPKVTPDACTGYLFFDPVHPAAPAHVILVERLKALFAESDVTFG